MTVQDLKDIVVGVDFSIHSEKALRQAFRLARSHHAALHVVHVIESVILADLADVLGTRPEAMRSDSMAQTRHRLQELLTQIGSQYSETVQSHIIVRIGNPFGEILRVVQEVRAGLLVLGAKGLDQTKEGAGVLATRCIRKAAAKVLIVRRLHSEPYRKICAFIDFSEQTDHVLNEAIHCAQRNASRLEICHVFLPPWRIVHYMSPSRLPTLEEQERYRQQIVMKLRSVLEPFESESRGLSVEYRLIESSEKVVAIDEVIAESGADLVVVSTRGRTGLRSIMMGTIAEHIIRTSPCSVLVVKPRDFRYEVD